MTKHLNHGIGRQSEALLAVVLLLAGEERLVTVEVEVRLSIAEVSEKRVDCLRTLQVDGSCPAVLRVVCAEPELPPDLSPVQHVADVQRCQLASTHAGGILQIK